MAKTDGSIKSNDVGSVAMNGLERRFGRPRPLGLLPPPPPENRVRG